MEQELPLWPSRCWRKIPTNPGFFQTSYLNVMLIRTDEFLLHGYRGYRIISQLRYPRHRPRAEGSRLNAGKSSLEITASLHAERWTVRSSAPSTGLFRTPHFRENGLINVSSEKRRLIFSDRSSDI